MRLSLCLTGPGQSSVKQLEVRRDFSWKDVFVWMRQPTNAMVAALPDAWPGLYALNITGEQRQHLQAVSIRTGQGMAGSG